MRFLPAFFTATSLLLSGTSLPALADALNTKADYAYILDGDTGLSLYSKNGDEAFIPASMTKIMTAYVVFERLRDGRLSLDDEFVVSETAWREGGAASGGSTMFLDLGSKVSVQDLLRGIIIQSGNDACIVIAEAISGSQEAFAEEMTRRAQELGLKSAHFENPTGLYSDNHRVSAADLAKLAYLTITEFPEYYDIYAEKEFTWNGIRQPNRNPLLGEVDGADGLKTGHLEISGYGLVGSAVRDGKRRIIVLNGLESIADRASEARRVMRAAFNDFKVVEVIQPDQIVGEAEVFLGTKKTVELKANELVKAALHSDAIRDIEVELVYSGPLKAPLKAGDIVGQIVVTAPGMNEIVTPAVIAESVERKNLFERALVGLGLTG
ncbi:D-alanyl-D-alanine carboxypeptidase family protein [Hirschia litorea]|uniref:serine-type D-Ala-D-Ala carboxypeptidase n=1 Tax=Hirschia litorea TaxID=1199156 RepID=A0ABW2II94_9PROT